MLDIITQIKTGFVYKNLTPIFEYKGEIIPKYKGVTYLG